MHIRHRAPTPGLLHRASMPGETLSPLQQHMLALIQKQIASDLEMPNNVDIAERLAISRESVGHTLRRLVAARRITIHLRVAERRICDLATGAMTRWGPFVLGHAPGSAKGAPRKGSPRYRGGESVPGLNFPFPPSPPFNALFLRVACTCQWPLWPHGARPTGKLCGAPTAPQADTPFRFSFCEAHLAAALCDKDVISA